MTGARVVTVSSDAECAPREADVVLECAGPLAWRIVLAEPNPLAPRVAQLLA